MYLHSQHLSEEKNFKNERQFAESRPIEHGEHNVSLCGQTYIEWEVVVVYAEAETLIVGKTYSLKLKAKYKQGQLTFTAL